MQTDGGTERKTSTKLKPCYSDTWEAICNNTHRKGDRRKKKKLKERN